MAKNNNVCYLTNQLSTEGRVLLEKLVVIQIVKKFSTFYETQGIITTIIRVYH